MDAADADAGDDEQLAPFIAQPNLNAEWPSSGTLIISSKNSVVNISGGSTVGWVAIHVGVASGVVDIFWGDRFGMGKHTNIWCVSTAKKHQY